MFLKINYISKLYGFNLFDFRDNSGCTVQSKGLWYNAKFLTNDFQKMLLFIIVIVVGRLWSVAGNHTVVQSNAEVRRPMNIPTRRSTDRFQNDLFLDIISYCVYMYDVVQFVYVF